jgi:bifunctional non-homologous end joining protein LigD
MGLKTYRQKRHFAETPEPSDKVRRRGRGALKFVIQRHEASRLHYDFRLEAEGVLKSWAVPKGPSLNPADKRLAVQVEDHPYSYRTFEGNIPEGHYGAGSVIIWDEGTYHVPGTTSRKKSEAAVLDGLKKGSFHVLLEGQKLRGEFILVQTKSRGEKNWLLMKKQDEYASEEDVTLQDRSVRSNRTNEEVAANHPTNSKLKKAPQARVQESARRQRRSAGPVVPMLATLVDEPFNRTGWIFEIKWDGYRALAEVDHGEVKLYSRNHKSFVECYAEVVDTLKMLDCQAVFDGEIVVVDDKGYSQFQLLQNYPKTGQGLLLYYVFDLLELNGQDLRAEPLRVRKQKLVKVIRNLPNVKVSEHIEERGTDYFHAARKLGIEGIIAKDVNSPYLEGVRSHAWLKIKTQQGQEAIIAGFTQPRGSRRYFGALILGIYEGNALVYIGHTGSGFNRQSLADLHAKLQALVQEGCPFAKRPKTNMPVTWVEPKLVCNVKFQEWTSDGILRQPIFLGLRDDKDPRSVHRERSMPSRSAAADAEATVKPKTRTMQKRASTQKDLELTNLDKVYFPDDGITKGNILEYYRDVAPVLLRYLKDRPMNLNRHPNGISQKNFYQKDISRQNPPAFVATTTIIAESDGDAVEYAVCQNLETLLYVVNLGCIELNPWNVRTDSLDHPDYLIFDLDPVELPFTAVVQVAQAFRQLLEELGLDGYCKTSGKRGLHVFLPLGAKVTTDQGRDFAEILALQVNRQLPDLTSLERSPAKRRKRVYLDIMQNRKGQSLAAPYSVRPSPGAPVSTPLKWAEVTSRLDPTRFTIKTTRRRLDQFGDLWKPVLGRGVNLLKALNQLKS